MWSRKSGSPLRLGALAAIMLFGGAASATTVNPFTDLGSAGPSNYAVLAIGGDSCKTTCGSASTSVTVQGSAHVYGNIGVAPNGNLTFDTTSKDYGKAYVDTGGTISNPSEVTGGITQNSATNSLLNSAAQAALLAYTDASGMAATITNQTNILNPSAPITITGTSGINVVNLSNLVLSNSSDGITLSAPSNGYFVINITGSFTISNGADINLAGGLSQYHVIYDVVGSGGGTVVFNGSNLSTVVNGIVLAPYRDVNVNGSLVNGEVIGGNGNIYVQNGGAVDVPEPGTLLLLGSGFLVLARQLRKRASQIKH